MKHKLRFNRHFHLNRKRYRPLCDGRRLAAPRNEVWGEGGVRQEKCGCVDVKGKCESVVRLAANWCVEV